MAKRRQVTDGELLGQIRGLASRPDAVRSTRSAQEGMVARNLTRAGVCQTICEYLDEGLPVDETLTDSAAGHIGKTVYEMYATIDAEDLFVKVGIEQERGTPVLLLISVHEQHRGT